MIEFFLVLLLRVGSQNLPCKTDFLNAYNIEGEKNARLQKMFFCPKVDFTCCNPFDEMRFHKNWYYYYKPKINETYSKAKNVFQSLQKAVTYFKNFQLEEYSNLVPVKYQQELPQLLFHLKKIEIDDQLRPLLNQFQKQKEIDVELKKGFFCQICSYSN